ncbi:hypothetical protein PsorP6_015031 [Peronosclerospora sorghi]|uniref:Uncharacterized protein n=1 Tax=Peronosclerospora sorghi TaxID=230839 RepID=A0ACC0VU03_9STRA|nr:hypothetical protein PsorP6_015031 [Peronosclerospora sorghi]
METWIWAYSTIMGDGLSKDVAMTTDDLFFRLARTDLLSDITPEAQVGGPIALVKNGDNITIDAEKNALILSTTSAAKKEWVAPPLKAIRGTLYKFIKNVKFASEGCFTDE